MKLKKKLLIKVMSCTSVEFHSENDLKAAKKQKEKK